MTGESAATSANPMHHTSSTATPCGDVLGAIFDELQTIRALLSSPSPARALVSASELAGMLGTTAEWVRDHADELGVVRLGNGTKPRLRFDPSVAMTRSASERSQDVSPSVGGANDALAPRRSRRLPNRQPKPGSILRSRPRGGG
jgi:hypothetical protein